MKFFVAFVALAVFMQSASAQCLRSACSPFVSTPFLSAPAPFLSAPAPFLSAPAPFLSAPAPIVSALPAPFVSSCGGSIAYPNVVNSYPQFVTDNSVANNLADTLSLLTVSSLLADTLPYGSCGCSPVVAGVGPVVSAAIGGCGCGGYYY